ncbi:MAG: nucleotidyltransferase family protein [Vicinamibacterales bacterium]
MPPLTHALLLTAGLGTRLHPLTSVRAKPAIPVAGAPMVVRIMTWLRGAGITDVVLNLHHLPESITTIIGDGSDLGVRARYSWEPVVLGSAGGPRQALDIIAADTFVIVNGDTLTNLSLPPLLDAHAASGALVTMAVVPNTQPQHYSGLRVDADGAVLGVVPRGSGEASFHFVGVQVANRHAFAGAPAGRPSNSVGDVYARLIAACLGARPTSGTSAPWPTTGTRRTRSRVPKGSIRTRLRGSRTMPASRRPLSGTTWRWAAARRSSTASSLTVCV